MGASRDHFFADSRAAGGRWPTAIGTPWLVLALMPSALVPELAGAEQPEQVLIKIGRLEHSPVREASGLVASRQYPGVFWTICDSENPPHLFAVDGAGRLLAEYKLDQTGNIDWESIAADSQGNLYIGDVGNNLGLPLRWVLKVREPDPRLAVATSAEPVAVAKLTVDKLVAYRFPAAPFDVEGMLFWEDSIYLLSKVRQGTGLYRLRLDGLPGWQTLVKVCAVPAIHSVTGADISADGRRVAICSYQHVVVFQLRDAGVTALADEPVRRIAFRAPGVEGCAWDGDDLLLVSEDRSLYRVAPP